MGRSIPSTKINGPVLSPKLATPRIQKEVPDPGSPDPCTVTTPAICPAKALLIFATGVFNCFGETEDIAPITLSLRCFP
ncbi:hypothetical protein D3C80_640620 [compost metagenome]